jgi:hypothetical protein
MPRCRVVPLNCFLRAIQLAVTINVQAEGIVAQEKFSLGGAEHSQGFRGIAATLYLGQMRPIAKSSGVEDGYGAALEIGQVHYFESLGAHNSQLVLQEVDAKRFGGDEKIFVESEPLATLAEEVAEWPTSVVITVHYRFENAE